jgi:hypothetical protein
MFIGGLIIFSIAHLFIFDSAALKIVEMAHRQKFLINSYKNPFRLTKNYIKSFLKIGNSTVNR